MFVYKTEGLALLEFLRKQSEWPPEFPRPGTILFPSVDPQTPRERWGAKEWEDYAKFLEESGARLMRDLLSTKDQLRLARRKLARSKRPDTEWAHRVLFGSIDEPAESAPRKRGRKPTRMAEAAEIIAIRNEMEAKGLRITDIVALGEWHFRNGRRRGLARTDRNRINSVSEYRKVHKIKANVSS